jgi:hypothetical protein
MPDVFRGGGVNGVLGNIGGMIAHAFEAAANKNQVQVTPQLFPVVRHALDQCATGFMV